MSVPQGVTIRRLGLIECLVHIQRVSTQHHNQAVTSMIGDKHKIILHMCQTGKGPVWATGKNLW